MNLTSATSRSTLVQGVWGGTPSPTGDESEEGVWGHRGLLWGWGKATQAGFFYERLLFA
ncbi:MAG: hypothetical protein KME25_15660 [Symplocastrum torsivum CPER-KK1]|uniref:Uncharacterized protein n=1 Tax=Symplocastrum torsivum CPER-KK1 TaxID=450513 RepID=A0A951U9X9_9CYAN|nr:hypothetical protein [Symplocastrum torsivum CPER-KK1]